MTPRWKPAPPFGKRALGLLWALAALALASGFQASDERLFAVPGGSGAWLSPGPALGGGDPLAVADPAATVVLVYNHGSEPEGAADPCVPTARIGGTTPRIVRNLAGDRVAGRRLAVFAFCTATKTGRFRNDGSGGPPKVAGRRDDIKRLVAALRQAGVPADQLFLMGHSAGGFASLLVERDAPDTQNAVIAFAPAFAGPRDGRSPAWSALRRRYVAHLQQGREIDALVFAFEDDAYNRPQDLAFLQTVPGVRLRDLSSRSIAGVSCGLGAPHRTVFLDCFGQTQEGAIHAYLAERLGASVQPPPGPWPRGRQPRPLGQPGRQGPTPVVQ